MGKSIGSKVEGLIDGLSDIDKPAIKELSRKLKRYVDAEATVTGDLEKLVKKAAALEVQGRALQSWAKKAAGADAQAYRGREREFTAAMDALGDFTTAIENVTEGKAAGKVAGPGDAIQAVIDKLEFSDKAAVDALRKAAKAYYPAESAGTKRLNEWISHLTMLITALNDGLAELNGGDRVEALHIAFARKEILAPAIALKRTLSGMAG